MKHLHGLWIAIGILVGVYLFRRKTFVVADYNDDPVSRLRSGGAL